MKILLDTHVFIWLKTERARFADATVRLFEDPANALYLSAASVWELAIKHATGRLRLPSSPQRYVAQRMAQSNISELAVTAAHALRAAALPAHHADPFDRMLVAQAQSEAMSLVTADRLLGAFDVALLAP